jgi:hypothetical protein
MDVSGGWRFNEPGGSTTVTRYSDSNLRGVMKWMAPLMVPMARRQGRKELAELKRLIEAG